MNKYIFCCLLSSFISFAALAQKQAIDSLKKVVAKFESSKNSEQDTNYLNTLNDLSFRYYTVQEDTALLFAEKSKNLSEKQAYTKGVVEAMHNLALIYLRKADYKKSLQYNLDAIPLAEKINYKMGLGKLYRNIGLVYKNQGSLDSSQLMNFKALSIFEKLNDVKNIVNTLNNIAAILQRQGNYAEALDTYLKSLRLVEKTNDKQRAMLLNNMALVYKSQDKLNEALEKHLEALKLFETINDKLGIGICLNNIALIYKNQSKYSEALLVYAKALQVREKMGDKEGIASIYNNMADVYLLTNEYQKALTYYQQVLAMNEKRGDKNGIAYNTNGLARVFLVLKDYKKSLQNGQQSMALSLQINNKVLIRDANIVLSQTYQAMGNYKQALYHHQQFKLCADSLNNLDVEKKTANLQANYEYDKKVALLKAEEAKKDIEKEKELQEQKFIRNSTLAGLGIMIVIAYLIFRSLQKQRKAKELLQTKNAEIQAQNDIIKESKEEILLQSEALKATNLKLIELDSFKQTMTSMIVHDLKNPLNVLINLPEYKFPEQLNKAKQYGRQMLNQVLNILDVHKYAATKMHIDLQPTTLYNLVYEAIGEVQFLAQAKAIIIHNELLPTVSVQADANMLHRVFVNLLTNAIKYTPLNGHITLQNTTDEISRKVTIKVIDTGQGIPADKLHVVFQQFGQVEAKNSGGVQSTGLGLTFCKLAIEAHLGSISVESEVGKGTTFILSLQWVETTKTETSITLPLTVFAPTREFVLSDAEKIALQPFVVQLKQYIVYETSALDQIIETLPTNSANLEEWKKDLQSAIEQMNEEKFETLLAVAG